MTTYASLFEIAKNKGEVLMSIDNRLDQLWHIHIMEYCIARKEMSKL